MHFQAILSKSLLTIGIFLRVLSNPFYEFKTSLGYRDIDDCKFNRYLNSLNC